MKIALRFYKTDWTDFWSVLSWAAHYIRLRRKPVFTHVSVILGMQEFFLSNKGLICINGAYYNSRQEYFDYQFHSIAFDIDRIETALSVYALTKLEINWADAAKFMLPNKHSNNCITFALCVLGFEVFNITADELFIHISQQDYKAFESQA